MYRLIMPTAQKTNQNEFITIPDKQNHNMPVLTVCTLYLVNITLAKLLIN